MVLIISDVEPRWVMGPDLADKAPSYEFAAVITQGTGLKFIQGKILKDDASKLSRIFPTLEGEILCHNIWITIERCG